MGRVLGVTDFETDLAHLMRAAERAGLSLACIETEDMGLALPGDVPAARFDLGRIGAWAVTVSLAVTFLVL